jgi:integral membrane protein
VDRLRDPLWRYRIMAWIVGTMLILVFICLIPAINKVDAVLGPIHGILYIVYLATVVNLLVTYRLGFWYFVGMVVAGWCPFISFITERLVTRRLAAPGPPPAGGPNRPAPADRI